MTPRPSPQPAAPESAAPESDAPDFTPVPSQRNRRDGWTELRQRGFIAVLAHTGLVTHAAAAVGMSPQSAQRLRHRAGADSFAAAWDAAVSNGLDQALDLAIERGLHGDLQPVYYRGKLVGERRRHNNRLLLRALTVLDKRAAAQPDPAEATFLRDG